MSVNDSIGAMQLQIDALRAKATLQMQADMESLRARMALPSVPNVEDAKTVMVGKTYFVNVVTTLKDSPALGASFPVLGDEHSDADFIFIYPDNGPHWHIDWRFIPEELYPQLVKMFIEFYGQNAELSGYASGTKNLQLACVLPGDVVTSVARWPLPCFRQQLRWEAMSEWLPNLEDAYKDKKACDNVCPHRGISLTGAPEDKNGARVCPGHGVAWGRDGCLVPRSELKW